DDISRLATKAQTIRSSARIFDNTDPSPSRTPTSPFPGRLPIPVPMPTPPTRGPNPADLRVARLYDAVNVSVERFLSQEVGRKALVIAALADDAKSDSTLRDALKTLKENDVIAYVLEVQHAPRRNERDDCDIR